MYFKLQNYNDHSRAFLYDMAKEIEAANKDDRWLTPVIISCHSDGCT